MHTAATLAYAALFSALAAIPFGIVAITVTIRNGGEPTGASALFLALGKVSLITAGGLLFGSFLALAGAS